LWSLFILTLFPAVRQIVLATCSLNQWALDFSGNRERILASISEAKRRHATYRLGPELELCGYGCEDHFLEPDTVLHSWQSLASIVATGATDGILCDFGLPVLHRNTLFNCRALVCDGRVLLIRPKVQLANDGNYRERRWFHGWCGGAALEEFQLPECMRRVTGQCVVPFGNASLQSRDGTVFGVESCEELFVPSSLHVPLGLDGVEVIGNGSGSHHELRKLYYRVDLMEIATRKNGGVYLYANQQGCDGGRLYYDGSCMIFVNGHLVAQGSQFSFRDVEVVTATVDIDAVRAYRVSQNSRGVQSAAAAPRLPRVRLERELLPSPALHDARGAQLTRPIAAKYALPSEEIGAGPACWLWDYLRRSGMAGFFLPLSGGADSSAVAAIVGCMCQMLFAALSRAPADGVAPSSDAEAYGAETLAQVRHVVKHADARWRPESARDLASRIFYTCYMGTSNSSDETRLRARTLAAEVGAHHADTDIDAIVAGFRTAFAATGAPAPQFRAHGGSARENVALQNIQARSRMVYAYTLAQLLPWSLGRPGALLVLSAGNVDEALRGYLTKYDCSAADLNPIGAVSKVDLKLFLAWAAAELGYGSLVEVLNAQPTAELEPRVEGYVQLDEVDMGMTYPQLGEYGRLRIQGRCGPLSMFERIWSAPPGDTFGGASAPPPPPAGAPRESARSIAKRVKHFFFHYGINRHKSTVLTPSYHAESYSPDDNRYDHRPFLYNSTWSWQFAEIDRRVAEIEAAEAAEAAAAPASPAVVSTAAAVAAAIDDAEMEKVRALLAAHGYRFKDGTAVAQSLVKM
jgi:NAD+ synthase (glutamine-hydrolysing)